MPIQSRAYKLLCKAFGQLLGKERVRRWRELVPAMFRAAPMSGQVMAHYGTRIGRSHGQHQGAGIYARAIKAVSSSFDLQRLEPRLLLSGNPLVTTVGQDPFAQLYGTVDSAGGVANLMFTVDQEQFTSPRGTFLLSFEVRASEGSSLDPQAAIIRNAAGNVIKANFSRVDLPGSTSSLSLVVLPFGEYTLEVRDAGGAEGAFEVDVALVGDLDGDQDMDQDDRSQLISLIRNRQYAAAADANRDGVMTSFDYSQALRNQGSSTDVRILELSADLASTPLETLPDGSYLVEVSSIAITGHTQPGAQVSLGNETVIADGTDGSFSFTDLPLDLGLNVFDVVANDAFGQSRTESVKVVRQLDQNPPLVTADNALVTLNEGDTASNAGTVSDPDGDSITLSATIGLVIDNGDGTWSWSFGASDGPDESQTVTITATDSGGASSDVSFALTVNNVAPSITVDSTSVTVNEGETAFNGGTFADVGDDTITLSASIGSVTDNGDGTWSWSFGTSDGSEDSQTVTITAIDSDGASSDLSFALTVNNVDADAPIITAALVNDTGASSSDGITSDATIAGQITDASDIATFKAGLNGAAESSFLDVRSLLQTNGSFTITSATLEQIAIATGQPLNDEALNELKLVATDIHGNQSVIFTLAFTPDTTAPNAPETDLTQATDSGQVGDKRTTQAVIDLAGRTTPGSQVILLTTGAQTVADGNGNFSFADVPLQLDENLLTMQAVDVAGNVRPFEFTVTRMAQTASDPVLLWNAVLSDAVVADTVRVGPTWASRASAMMNAAMYDAAMGILRTHGLYHVDLPAPVGASAEAAAAAAAHHVLVSLFPLQQPTFDAALVTSLTAIADGTGKSDGVAYGIEVARRIVALRVDDGSEDLVMYVPGSDIGQWRPTFPNFAAALTPHWGGVTPFTLTSADQFQAPAPPALDSAQYAASFDEVYELGRIDSTTRTADQTEIGLFWSYDRFGMGSPIMLYQQAAITIAEARGNTMEENVQLFALLGLTMADTGIAGWETKYHYELWRPITAIHEADQDGNPLTAGDPNWLPLGAPGQTPFTPNHPSYISGHSSFGTAAFEAMELFYGTNAVPFSMTSAELPDVVREFDNFGQAIEENGRSRIYLGIHWDYDDQFGRVMGTQVAQHVASNHLLAVSGPTVSARLVNDTGRSDLDRITAEPAVFGRVYGSPAGTSLRGAVNQSNPNSFVDLSVHLQPDGSFALDRAALETMLGQALSDGEHTVHLQAGDSSGFNSTVFTLTFVLDTAAPSVLSFELDPAFDTDPVGDQMTTAMIVRLIGQTEPGAQLQLVETGAVVIADESGAFTFDSVPLAIGGNDFTIKSTDVAGNARQSSITLTRLAVDQVPPQITASLVNDTGLSNADGVTFDATITGSVTDADEVIAFGASLDGPEGGPYVDILELRQSDGSFTLDRAELEQILGSSLTDGAHTLRLVATDQSGNTASELVLNFTLDTQTPTQASFTLSAESRLSPTNPALTALGTVTIAGQTDPGQFITLNPTGATTTSAGDGSFNFTDLALNDGLNPFTTVVEDIAGNRATFSLSITQVDPALDPLGGDTIVLAEGSNWLTEHAFLIDLGQTQGNRRLSFNASASFDTTDADVLVGDLLQVYLVDPANPGSTLLDRGREGDALFSLGETGADFLPGLVTFNGTTVTVDLTSLEGLTQGLLIIQLISGDSDESTTVTLSQFTNVTDEEGVASPVFLASTHLAQPGPAVDLTGGGYTAITDGSMDVSVTNIRVDGEAGSYLADLSLRNLGELVSRGLVVRFNNLPAGVELVNASGLDGDGNPYLNLAPAVNSGGLDIGAFTAPVELTISNPDGLRFELDVTVLSAGANRAPVFAPLAPVTVMPGAQLQVPLLGTDPDGDAVYFTIKPNGPLPTMTLGANGQLTIKPSPDQIGSYSLTVIANDGTLQTSQTLQIDVIADPITTTRLSGIVQNTDLEPLAGITVAVGEVMATTDADGRFELEFTGELTSDTMKIAGFLVDADHIYPSLTEELSLLLDHAIFAGVNNQIPRPIFLPLLDLSAGTQITPGQDTTITSAALPGLAIHVDADTLKTPEGDPFTGVIAIGLVPRDLTPAGLPEGIFPGTVITIQPGGMVFTAPAPITFPNTDGFAPGEIVDLWSANPNTGRFELVGKLQASADGQLLRTIEGGLINTSWHFPAPPVPETSLPPSDAELENQDEMCNSCEATEQATSTVELHSGAILESHRLVSYQSQGQTRGITLHYDSQRADPRPIVHFSINNNTDSFWPYAYARLAVTDGELRQAVAGYDPSIHAPVDPIQRIPPFDLDLYGAHFWNIQGPGVNNLKLALQADMRNLPSGVYEYQLERGLTNMSFLNQRPLPGASGAVALRMVTNDTGLIVLVNAIDSPFGAGWQVGGIQQLVESPDGSVLLIDGDGTNVVFTPIEDQPGQFLSPVGDFSTLVQNADNSFTRTTKDKSIYQYDEAGHLTSMTDRNGNTTTHVYEAGRLVGIVDPVGLETSFTYSGDRVSSITDPAGRVTLLEHDAAGNLIRVTDPDGASRAFEYDSGHHIIAEVDQAGEREQTIYGFHGRAIGSIRKDGTTLTFDPVQTRVLLPTNLTTDPVSPARASIAAAQAIARTADANGNTTTTVLDKAGQVIRTIDSVGSLPSVVRNSDNLVDTMTDARGFVTQYQYDDRGNLISVADDVSRGVTVGGMTFPGEKFMAGSRPYSVTVGDFNGDGISDLAVANSSSNDVSVLLGRGDGTFAAQQRFTVGSRPRSVTAGDFNGDGVSDLAVANRSSNDVSVLLGVGDGTFAVQQRFGTGSQPISVSVGDFNGDGISDLAVANRISNDVSVLLGLGDGTFAAQQRFASGAGTYSVTVGDFNGDGVSDLAVANANSGDVSVLLGNGDGTFAAQQRFAAGSQPQSVTVGDFNGDGVSDLAVANYSSNDVSVLLGNGDGTFASQQRFAAGSEPRFVMAGDFNGDGISDLAVANDYSNDVSVLLGLGDGSFLAQQRFAAGSGPYSVTMGDFNGDGISDLAVANYASNDVSVLLGGSDGTFAAQQRSAAGSFPTSVTVGDFNGDGISDLATANYVSNDVSVLLGLDDGTFTAEQNFAAGTNPQSVTVGDFNGDGISDLAVANRFSDDVSVLLGVGDGTFADQQRFGTGVQPISVSVGDFNGDGISDLAVANRGSNDVSVLLGVGDGSFADQQTFAAGDIPSSVSVGDFNGDGISDLATSNFSSDDVSVLLGVGDGTFTGQQAVAAGSSPYSVSVGDFNGDGISDLATANFSSDDVSVLLGVGDGTFAAQQRFSAGDQPFSVSVGDFDGDGNCDLTVANRYTNDVSVLLGVGDGSFAAQRRFAAGKRPQSVTVGDFNSDGISDLAVANGSSNDVSVLLGSRGAAGAGPIQPIKFTYDDTFNQLTSITDELGRVTLFDIDPINGNLLAVIQVIGERDSVENGETDDLVTTYTYTPQGLLDLMVDPLGRITDIDYDSRGLITTITKAVGTAAQATQSFEYDAAGNSIAVIDENGNRSQFDFDAMNRVTRMTEADPDESGPLTTPITEVAYDARGRLVEVTDAAGSKLERLYDALDRLILTRDNDGNETVFTYDLDGNLIEAIDPNGNTTRFTYDARDRRSSIIDPDAGVTTFRYDSSGNLLFLTDPNGNRTSFAYDARSRLVREVDPLGAESLYSYDAVDNLTRKTDRNERVTQFEYDDLNRLISETWKQPGGATVNTIDYVYDKASNLLSVFDNVSALELTYDSRNRVKTVDNTGTLAGSGLPGVVLGYTYDGVGNVLSVTETIGGAAGATSTYTYDALNRMTQVTQMGASVTDKRVDLAYNAIGQFSQINRFSDLTGTQLVIGTDYTYDALNRLTSMSHDDAGGSAVAFYNFEYDPASRITAMTDIDGRTDYSYDDRDQLTGASHDVADTRGDEDYTYDANGNRVDSHLHGSGYVTGANNRLLSDGTFNYAYDNEGNMILKANIATGEVREFEWDHRNRLVRVTDRVSVGGIITQEVEYVYDAMNRRIAKTVDADGEGVGGERTEHYVYDRMHVALEFIDADGSGAAAQPELTLRNLFGPGIDQILAQEDIIAAQTRWLLTDHLGTVRDIVSDAGIVLNHILYDSFGNILSQTDPAFATRYGFTGREFDAETGLHYFRARYYDGAIGRFVSEDPIGFFAMDTNLYRYVFNNPVGWTDPWGLEAAQRNLRERATSTVQDRRAITPFRWQRAALEFDRRLELRLLAEYDGPLDWRSWDEGNCDEMNQSCMPQFQTDRTCWVEVTEVMMEPNEIAPELMRWLREVLGLTLGNTAPRDPNTEMPAYGVRG